MVLFKCSLCFYSAREKDQLQNHIIKRHKNHPYFNVKCSYDGCGATFKKWESYTRHLYRRHTENLNHQDVQNDQIEIMAEEENRAEPHEVHEADMPVAVNARVEQVGLCTAERLNWHAAEFLLNIRENCKTSHVAIEKIKCSTTALLSLYLSTVLDEIQQITDPNTDLVRFNQVETLFNDVYPASMLFNAVSSKWYFDKYLIDKFRMVCPEEVIFGTSLRWKKKKMQDVPQLIEVKDRGYVIPFLENLRVLLMNEEVRKNIQTAKTTDGSVLRTVLDGSYYKENEFFRTHQNALAIVIYYDDLGIANPLGSHSRQEKLSNFYWTIGNITPELRSSENVIQLLGSVKFTVLKKHGFSKIFKSFIDDIKILQTEGLTVEVNGENINFKGSVLFCAADTPAAAALGGFKESVSAYRLCRSCLATKDDWKLYYNDHLFIARNADTHRQHVQMVSTPDIPENTKNFWQHRYGVNGCSPLDDLSFFDPTQCLPQDLMHLILEGIGEVNIRLLLRFYIVVHGLFTVDDLNAAISNFDFGPFKDNKPVAISREHLDSSLKLSASERFGLLHTLPFLIAEWIPEDEELVEPLLCYIRLLQILNVCCSYEIHPESIDLLERMIEVYIMNFNTLFPDTITPKFHFLIHLPRYIRLFGPARQQWCMRFEGFHNYFKSLVPIVRNFKNMAYTLCYRHQARLCSRLATAPGSPPKPFLYQGDEIRLGDSVLLENLPNAHLFNALINENHRRNCRMLRTQRIKRHGTIYEPHCAILLECDEDSLPVFGVIHEIFILNDRIFFLYTAMNTFHFDDTLNAYRIVQPHEIRHQVIEITELIFPHTIPQFKHNHNIYVLLLDHEHTEFQG